MRQPAEITQESAASIAKWRMRELLEADKKLLSPQRMPMMKSFAMGQAIQADGGVDEIAKMLYALGIKLSIDKNNPDHKEWIRLGAVEIEQK